MNNRTITIINNPQKKGLSYQRPFTCQVFDSGNKRTYVLDDTKCDVMRKHFILRPGCRIIEDGVTHIIKDIWYPSPPSPIFKFLLLIGSAVL